MTTILKMRVILVSGTLTLPDDWSATNRIWLWGAGGRGMNDAFAPFLTGGGGGGGGGFRQVENVGGSPGDLWTINVGVKNLGGTGGGAHDAANASFVKGPSLAYLVGDDGETAYIDSGNNGASQAGAMGGSAGSIANSNSGESSNVGGGGGGGGGAPGPYGTGGLFNKAAGTKGGVGQGFGGGGGGGGGQGDFITPEETLATNGVDSASATGGLGGTGYYGTGAGTGGSSSPGGDGTSNLGGGGGGGYGPKGGGNNGTDGGDGADWDYILGLTPNSWLDEPFTFTTSTSGRWAILSNGTVPAGGGGAGGGAYGGNGGDGGFPGGGGGGAADSFGSVAVGGSGADGLIIVMYEGETTPVPPPTPGGSGLPYFIERMDNRIWPTIEAAWCVDSGLRYPMPEPDATLNVSSATGDQNITEYNIINGGSGYTTASIGQVTDLNPNGGTGATLTLGVSSGVIVSATPVVGGSGYINPQVAVLDTTGVGAVIQPIITNFVQMTTNTASFTSSDVGSIVRVGGGKLEIVTVGSTTASIANVIVPITATVPNDPDNTPVPAASGDWSMTAPTTTVSGLAHLAGLTVVALADGGVVTDLTVDDDGAVTLPAEATAITVGLPFVAQLQTMYMDLGGGPTVQGRRKDVTQVILRVEGSRAPEIGLNQPDAAAQPNQAEPVWGVQIPGSSEAITAMTQIQFRMPQVSAGQPVPLWSGDLPISNVFSTWDQKGQVAVQQRDPVPLGVTALISSVKVGDSTGQG